MITHYIRLVYTCTHRHTHTDTHLPRWSSGRVSGVATGNGGDTVDEGVGATGRKIKEKGSCM